MAGAAQSCFGHGEGQAASCGAGVVEQAEQWCAAPLWLLAHVRRPWHLGDRRYIGSQFGGDQVQAVHKQDSSSGQAESHEFGLVIPVLCPLHPTDMQGLAQLHVEGLGLA